MFRCPGTWTFTCTDQDSPGSLWAALLAPLLSDSSRNPCQRHWQWGAIEGLSKVLETWLDLFLKDPGAAAWSTLLFLFSAVDPHEVCWFKPSHPVQTASLPPLAKKSFFMLLTFIQSQITFLFLFIHCICSLRGGRSLCGVLKKDIHSALLPTYQLKLKSCQVQGAALCSVVSDSLPSH